MANAHLQIFQSEFHMLKFFGSYLPKLDVDASSRLSPYLYSYDNELVLARNFYEFLTQMEHMTALGIDTRASVQKGPSYLVFFNQLPKDPAVFTRNVEELAVLRENTIPRNETVPVVTLPLVATTIDGTGTDVNLSLASTLEKYVSSSDISVILDQASKLKDDSKKAASKNALEAFALTHGVSLSRAKTFDSMMEDFKSAIEAPKDSQ